MESSGHVFGEAMLKDHPRTMIFNMTLRCENCPDWPHHLVTFYSTVMQVCSVL